MELTRSLGRAAAAAALVLAPACQEPAETHLQPDARLQAELGLTLDDRVHRVQLVGGEVEHAEPSTVWIDAGAYVEFVTTDWLIHEVIFEEDSVTSAQQAFLRRTDQIASPPLLELDARYVLTFEGAPPGRYPYRLEGNGGPGRGVIVLGGAGP